MYRLYWSAGSGALAPQVMCEELGVPHELVPVDIAAGEHRSPAYLRINPAGQVPALELPDGRIVTESAAMVLVLGERYRDGGLVPAPQDPDRPDFLRWLLFMATSVYTAYAGIHHSDRYTTHTGRLDGVREAAIRSLEHHYTLLDDAIAGDPWFLPRGYGALDIYLTMLTDWHPERDRLLHRHPVVGRLCAATEQREAFARVMARHRDE